MTPAQKNPARTEKKEDGVKLPQFEKRILDTSSIGVLITRIADGTILYVNKATTSLLGIADADSMIGTPVPNFYWDAEDRKAVLARFRAEGSITSNEVRARKADGGMIWVSLSIQPFDFEGEQVLLSEIVDITDRKQAEEALRTSEQRYQTIFNSSPVMFWLKDTKNNMIQINQAAAAFENVNPKDMQGRSCYEVYPHEQAEAFYQDDLTVIRSGAPKLGIVEKHTSPGTGKTTWLETGKVPIWDDKGEVTGVLAFGVDITDRQQAEEAVRESEERFKRFTEASVEGLVFHEQGKMFDANPACLALFGLSGAEIIGRNLLEFVSPESRQLVMQQMQLEAVLPYEIQCVRKDGTIFPVETSTRAYQEGGRVFRVSSIRDITARKKAEEELRRIQTIVETAPDFIGTAAPDRKVSYVNPAGLALTGYTAGELHGGMEIGSFQPTLPPEVLGIVMKEGLWQGESEFFRKDGSRFPVSQVITLSRDTQGQVQQIITIARDITERKQAEEVLQLEEIRLNTLVQLGQMTEASLSDIAHFALEGCVQITKSAIGYLAFMNDDESVLTMYAWSKTAMNECAIMDKPIVYPLETTGLWGECVRQRKPIITNDYQAPNPHKKGYPSGHVHVGRHMNIPVFDGDRIVAVAGVGNKEGEYDEGDVRQLRLLMDGMWRLIQQKQLKEQIVQTSERRGYQVQVSTEISQEVAAATEISDLYHRVVTLTRERLGYYHTQLLRYDPAQDAVVLINGYGEIGQQMLAGGHKMPMGSGLIGTAAASGETVMRPALAKDPDWQPNPLLPETKGEIAVPIKWQDKILGVLDVQSDQAGALTEDDRLLLEGLCGQIAIAMEQIRLRSEMAERLEEINRLYRAMSHEGWKTYRDTAELPAGFMFDQAGVKPVEDVSLSDELFARIPMKVMGGEVVGSLAVADDPQRPISKEDLDFLQQVSDQIALALEGARLSAQTQSALAQTEKLSEAGLRFTRAADLQELVQIAVETLDIQHINRAVLETFSYNSENEVVGMDVIANWWSGTGREPTAVNTHYTPDALPILSLFITPEPIFIADSFNDKRVDEVSMQVVRMLNVHAVAVLPLFLADRQIGVLLLESEEVHEFNRDEIRVFSAMGPLISTVLENRRQFERARQQAEREGLLNVISQKIQSATSVEAVLQIAARELGHALGAPITIAQLSMKDKK